MSIHLLWNQEPQQAKKEYNTIIVPNTMAKESALSKAYCGKRVAYPSYAMRSQTATPKSPHPEIWKKIIRK